MRFYASLAGGCFVLLKMFVAPDYLHWSFSGHVLMMTLLGGIGTLTGPLLGAVSFVWFQDWVSSYDGTLDGVYWDYLYSGCYVSSERGVWMAIQKIETTTVLERESANHIVALENVHFSYGITPIIKNLSFGVKKGEIRAIIGPNGAGKSTVLHLLSGRNNPQSGDIIFNGKPITHLKPEKRRHLGMSRSFQITNIFGAYTVYENVRLAVQGMKDSRYNFWKPIKSYADVHQERFD